MKYAKYLIISILLFGTVNYVYSREIDRIVAIVNDDIIMNSEVEKILKAGDKKMTRQAALDQLINLRLRAQVVKNIGIEVTAEMVDEAVNQIAQQNNLSLDELAKVLPQEGLSMEKLRSNLKKEIEETIFQRAALKGKSIANQAELKQQIAKQPQSTKIGETPKYYHVSHILLALPEVTTPTIVDEKKDLADTIINKLKQGVSFEDMAKAHSNSATAAQGGDLGWRLLDGYPEIIAKVLPKMSNGDLEGPIKDINGLHIIKLNETDGGEVYKNFTYEERKKQAQEVILKRKAEKHISKMLRQMRDEAYIEIRL